MGEGLSRIGRKFIGSELRNNFFAIFLNMNQEKLKKIHKIIRVVLIIIPIIVFIWLVDKNLVPSGKLSAQYNFKEISPFISRLYPVGRVLGVEKNIAGQYYQPVIIDPVYFNVHLPVSFKKVHFIFKYKTNNSFNVRLGYQVGTDFSYYFKNLIPIRKEGDWLVAETDFDLANAYIKNNKLKFAISSPRLDERGGEIKINSIQLTLEKDPLTLKSFPALVKKVFEKIF